MKKIDQILDKLLVNKYSLGFTLSALLILFILIISQEINQMSPLLAITALVVGLSIAGGYYHLVRKHFSIFRGNIVNFLTIGAVMPYLVKLLLVALFGHNHNVLDFYALSLTASALFLALPASYGTFRLLQHRRPI